MSATHAQHLQQTYAQIAQGYDQITANKMVIEEMQQFVHYLKKGSSILDLGCGPGRDAVWFTQRGYSVTLFDLSPELLAIAKSKLPDAHIIQGDMTALPFENNSFDGIWANASLLHLTKKEFRRALQKVYEILTPDGMFFCSLKEGTGEQEIEEDKYGKPMKRFFSLYTKDELEKVVTSTGFDLVDSYVRNSPAQSWVHVFARKL